MTNPLPTIRMRRARRQSSSQLTIAGLGVSAAITLTLATVILSLTFAYASLTRSLPSPEMLPALLEPPDGVFLQPTRIYDRHGQQVLATLAHPAASQKKYLLLDETKANALPATLVVATQIASDRTFWTHPGYSLAGIRQGSHPTLAQRLVSELLLVEEPPGVSRAVRERLLAAQLTHQYGREKVMEWFLNSAYYGNQTYGADAAARVYFGKSATDLTLFESAILAGVAEAPALNPLDTPAEAVDRGQDILIDLLELGLIQVEEFKKAWAEKPLLKRYPTPARDPSAAFTNLVLDRISEQIKRERLERGGLRIITTLDSDLQRQADCAMTAQLAHLHGEEPESLTPEGEPCQTARLLPNIEPSETVTTQDLHVGAVVLDVASGEILALVGEPPPEKDTAQPPGHPPGSLLTPYIHLAAYTRGLSPGSLTWDIPANIPLDVDFYENTDNTYHGPIRLRTALANDYLVPSLALLAQIGPENVWRSLPELGLTSLEIPRGVDSFNLPLDGGQVNLVEITHAFSIFSNLGVLIGETIEGQDRENGSSPIRAVSVLRIEDSNGYPIWDTPATESRPVVSAQLAYLMTHVLSDEPVRWPSLGHPNLLEIGRPTGVKIGQTLSGHDAWTVGFTPQIAVGVWFGRDDNSSPGMVSVNFPAGLWHAIMQHASQDLPPTQWEQPPGISKLDVCDPSGMLPTPECPTIVSEVFLSGNEPTQFDTLYRRIQVNQETGRLATIFTPPEAIEDRVYLVVPPQAAAWAAEAGLPTPPESYDRVIPTIIDDADVAISKPDMFSYVRGQVTILGSASGEAFESYRLHIGQGLNPQNWLQLGVDRDQPVDSGILSVWDTEGLHGLYALRLQVVREDQRVDTSIIQVTVDNQPPEVIILNPEEASLLNDLEADSATLHARVQDDLALERVNFYLDNTPLITLTEPPFAVPWNFTPGVHTLRVRAYDQAGNMSEDQVRFEVIDR